MKGTITKQRDGKYKYRIYFGTIDGHDCRKQKGGFTTRLLAEKEMNSIIAQMSQTGEYVISKKISLQEVYNEFLEKEGTRTRRYATLVKYESILKNHLAEYFRNNFISNITGNKLNTFLSEKCDEYSSEYVNSMYNLLMLLFEYAVRQKYILKNPMEGIPRPVDDEEEDICIYTDQELLDLRQLFDGTIYLTPFMLGLYLGVRSGECFGLCWSDIDWAQNTITINKQLQRQDGRWCFTPPKTKNSTRTIKFGSILKRYLLELKKEQESDSENSGVNYLSRFEIFDSRKRQQAKIVVDDFINRKQNGQYMIPGSQKYAVLKVKDQLNLYYRYHNLRHTHATKLLEKGCNPKYVQARLGHGQLSTTLKLYAHVTASMEATAALLSDSFLPVTDNESIPEVEQAIADIENINSRLFPALCKDIVSGILGQTIYKLKNLQELIHDDMNS